MGKFKEQKRKEIEVNKEQGDAAGAAGEQRVRELQAVKGMIDSAYFRDDIDKQQFDQLNEAYHQAGVEAHKREVESVVDSARENLEVNKSDIAAERTNVESAIDKIGDMKGVTDLARSEAGNVERNLQVGATEYRDMETITENIEAEQEQKSRSVLNRIESIFG